MINGLTYNQLAAECHANNAKWWHDIHTGERLDRNDGELLMLVVSEIAEAMEAERKNLKDDKLPHRPGAEVELVDAIIRLGDFAGARDLDLDNWEGFDADLSDNKGEALAQISKAVLRIHDIPVFSWRAEQIAHTLDMIRAYGAKWGYDLDGAYVDKTAFNKVRKDHTHEARRAEGGKQF